MISKHESENIRSLYNSNLSELSKRLLNSDLHSTYHYIYVGEVRDNKDPEKIGKIKVRVINLLDGIKDSDLPWFYPIFPITEGSWSVPSIGDFVECCFDRGDIYCGKYLGKAINKDQIPSQAIQDYPNTILLYQTKNGSYCSINKLTGEYKIVNPVGAKITMSALGEVSIDAPIVSISHKAGALVTTDPTGGPFCAIPICPLTGIPHQGSSVINS
jgi:hypothetical protein